jgi:hypothetical protein
MIAKPGEDLVPPRLLWKIGRDIGERVWTDLKERFDFDVQAHSIDDCGRAGYYRRDRAIIADVRGRLFDVELGWFPVARGAPHCQVTGQDTSNHLLAKKAGATKNGNQDHVCS